MEQLCFFDVLLSLSYCTLFSLSPSQIHAERATELTDDPIAVNTQTSSLCLHVLYQSASSSLTLFLFSFSSFAFVILDPLAPLLCITPLRKVMVPVECESIQPFVGILVRMRRKTVGSLRIVEIR